MAQWKGKSYFRVWLHYREHWSERERREQESHLSPSFRSLSLQPSRIINYFILFSLLRLPNNTSLDHLQFIWYQTAKPKKNRGLEKSWNRQYKLDYVQEVSKNMFFITFFSVHILCRLLHTIHEVFILGSLHSRLSSSELHHEVVIARMSIVTTTLTLLNSGFYHTSCFEMQWGWEKERRVNENGFRKTWLRVTGLVTN